VLTALRMPVLAWARHKAWREGSGRVIKRLESAGRGAGCHGIAAEASSVTAWWPVLLRPLSAYWGCRPGLLPFVAAEDIADWAFRSLVPHQPMVLG